MTILEQINQDLAEALRSGQSVKVSTLRLLVNSLKNEKIKLGSELSTEQELKVLQREAKQRKDSIEAYAQAGRNELVADEQAELDIIGQYLPEQMSPTEVEQIVDQVIAELGASGQGQMGAVIGKVMALTAGRADGGVVAQIVRQKLTA